MFQPRHLIPTLALVIAAGAPFGCGSGMHSSAGSEVSLSPPASEPSSLAAAPMAGPDPLCGEGWKWDGTHCAHQGPSEAGLRVEDLTLGAGREAAAGDTVRIHYVGMLANGTSFDSSRNREPLKATLGRSMLIPGFDRGVQGMRVGGRRRITVPPELGYGKEGQPPRIPGNATLVFEVELMEIQDYAPPRPSGTPGAPGGPGTPPAMNGGRM